MKHATLAACFAVVCLSLTGCGDNAIPQPGDDTFVQRADIASQPDGYISPQRADAEFREQEFIRQTAAADSTYTFEKAEPEAYWQQITQAQQSGQTLSCGCIMRLFDEETTVCPSEKYCALMLGKIWALFGEPNDPSMYEDFFNYTVRVTAADGTSFYLELYQYSGCPSVGGPVGDETYEAAAKALAAKVCAAEPVDYEWSGTYEDFDLGIRYYVKDGVAGLEEHWPDGID